MMGKKLELLLRRLSVRQRMTAIIALLLLPLALLSAVSLMVLNEQEMAFRDSVEESVHGLLPLSTLEHYLQQALVDELLAESHDSVPDFAALTQNVDSSFSSIQLGTNSKDLPEVVLADAQKAWQEARPSVRRLVEQVHSRDISGSASSPDTRIELERAIADISSARGALSGVLKARYERAAAQRISQLRWLMWSWLITLSVAGLLVVVFLRSVLLPLQALTDAARGIEEGHFDVRVAVSGRDELAVLGECFNRMTAHWEVTHATLQTESLEDPLTGVLNRRGILSRLDAELEIHRSADQPLSVLTMDLDRFKFINDHYGHSTGDRALAWVASTIRGLLRANDHLGRHGGDEFIAVLPGTSHIRALEVARRIGEVVREGAAGEDSYPEITIGVASTPEDGDLAASLLEVADARLYTQKRERKADALAHEDSSDGRH